MVPHHPFCNPIRLLHQSPLLHPTPLPSPLAHCFCHQIFYPRLLRTDDSFMAHSSCVTLFSFSINLLHLHQFTPSYNVYLIPAREAGNTLLNLWSLRASVDGVTTLLALW
ncbi:hypothetical protein EVAR_34288_1 [Eumeta japonica]|uniref:Uncharacterized protein n=1 Tax=Eumeta variegata TaxID=151549 RepID=A0A4C1VYF9_EUMVA|nr:hypothetical protein EVAR_34288_1 [Eumeta japonica]